MKGMGLSASRALSAAVAVALSLAAGLLIRPALARANAPAESLQVLSAADAQKYAAALEAARRGDFAVAETAERGVADPLLMGEIDAVRLLHPAYRASYAELTAWLDHNADLPQAQRIYDLALKRKPRGGPRPRSPAQADQGGAAAGSGDAARAISALPRAANRKQLAARAAFYRGDVARAYELAQASGERWIAGLSAYRLKRYDDALAALSMLADDARQDPWVRSAAAYWASRSATAAGQPATRSRELLKLAARAPDTFYGLIAARELDQQAAAAPQGDPIGDVLAAATVDSDNLSDLVRTSPVARRAVALSEIGAVTEAGDDLRLALASAKPAERVELLSLAIALNTPLGDRQDLARRGWAKFDQGHFPTPVLTPEGGFTIDKALVYALVRQESRFDPNIKSRSGAIGLMQIKAETAARAVGDDKLKHDPAALKNPAVNLRVGQAYVGKLLRAVKGDVIRAVAAYNCGPGVIDKLVAKLGENVDSLMLVESLPKGQTRNYVQRVMANYWTYRQIFGHDSPTLNAAAAGVKAVAAADR